MNTRIDYLYRDAGNWKTHGSVVLAGLLTPEQITAMRRACEDGERFIASQVGLPDLQTLVAEAEGGFPTEDDHVWSEFETIQATDEHPTLDLTASDFCQGFIGVAWDVTAAMERLGFTFLSFDLT